MTRRSPTVVLLGLLVVVYLLETLGALVGAGPAAFALALPLSARPWTLVTSVFAHATLSHLLANAVALALAGLFLERRTSASRLYLFFLGTGALTGLAQVFAGALFGRPVAVLGASGAIFALWGYLLAGNRVTETLVGGVSVPPRVQVAVFLLLAGVVTYLTAAPGVALVSHFTGLLLGLLAGRAHLLRAER